MHYLEVKLDPGLWLTVVYVSVVDRLMLCAYTYIPAPSSLTFVHVSIDINVIAAFIIDVIHEDKLIMM